MISSILSPTNTITKIDFISSTMTPHQVECVDLQPDNSAALEHIATTSNGADYRGVVSMTKTGYICQKCKRYYIFSTTDIDAAASGPNVVVEPRESGRETPGSPGASDGTMWFV